MDIPKVDSPSMKNPSLKANQQILFYLHGQIVEGSDGRPKSAQHGYYEYSEIVETFTNMGFETISEIRPKNTNVREYAQNVASRIGRLISSGVPENHITVVGASKGGIIAAHVSNILKCKNIRYVLLAGLFSSLYEQDHVTLFGEVLSVHDESDQFTIAPDLFFENSPGLVRSKKIVTSTGLGHGFLYKPYPIWLEELMDFCGFSADTIDEVMRKHRGSRY